MYVVKDCTVPRQVGHPLLVKQIPKIIYIKYLYLMMCKVYPLYISGCEITLLKEYICSKYCYIHTSIYICNIVIFVFLVHIIYNAGKAQGYLDLLI